MANIVHRGAALRASLSFLQVTTESVASFVVPSNVTASVLRAGSDSEFTVHASGRPVLVYSGPPRRAIVRYGLTFQRATGGGSVIHFSGVGHTAGAIPTASPTIAASSSTVSTGFYTSHFGADWVDLVDTTHIAPMFANFLTTVTLQTLHGYVLVETLEP